MGEQLKQIIAELQTAADDCGQIAVAGKAAGELQVELLALIAKLQGVVGIAITHAEPVVRQE